jgi:hypothetical protein
MFILHSFEKPVAPLSKAGFSVVKTLQ